MNTIKPAQDLWIISSRDIETLAGTNARFEAELVGLPDEQRIDMVNHRISRLKNRG